MTETCLEASELFNIRGKVILITGGSRGIGFMIAKGFLANGAERVYITARKREACDRAAKELGPRCISLPADLSLPEEMERLAKELSARESRLHVLVNNAGTNWSQPIDRYSMESFDKVIRLNLTSAFQLTRLLLPLMERTAYPADPARIINIGSINGVTPPTTVPTFAYSASKAALHMLTKHLALELASKNITVNAIAPGMFESQMTRKTLEQAGDLVVEGIPLRRIGRPSDMAAVCLWLSSPGGSYVDGAVIVVDGGAVLTAKL